MQGIRVRSLVRELEPTCPNWELTCHKEKREKDQRSNIFDPGDRDNLENRQYSWGDRKGNSSLVSSRRQIIIECYDVLDGKESTCSAGDLGSIPGLGRSRGGEHGNPPQYSCLENSMDRGTWWVTVHGITKSQTWLSDYRFHLLFLPSKEKELNWVIKSLEEE